LNLKKLIKIKNVEKEEFNEIINEEYRKKQINFCRKINNNLNRKFEDRIKLAKVIFNNITYNMFVYKNNDIVSKYISNQNIWEKLDTNNIINGLNYYTKKKNLIYKDIYIIDVGGNIGWYTFLLGKYGYNLITFEPSKINYYILNKNFCLNKNLNITIINKGLFPEEKICNIYSAKNNIGNGMINCNEKIVKNEINNGKIILTKFRNYISYFENKNLAMIKMDIEGSEGKALESGIEFITKYHVPFIFIEFTPNLLIEYGTNPKKFLEIFIRNGYKINLQNFFEQKVYDIEYLSKKTRNLYIVYTSFLK
jgi:FkbM family methyltransferase